METPGIESKKLKVKERELGRSQRNKNSDETMRPNGLTLAMGKSLWKLSGVINRRMGAKKEEGIAGGGLLISFQFTWNAFLLSGALMKFLISNKKQKG